MGDVRYVRFQATTPNRQGWFPGVFGLVDGPAREAAAWFRSSAVHLIERGAGYLAILDDHGVGWVRLDTQDPGQIVYEDTDQVVTTPCPQAMLNRFRAQTW